MSTKHSPRQKRTDRRRAPGYYLGVDSDGRKHVFLTDPDRIHVVADDTVVFDEPVRGRSVESYCATIDERVGWRAIWFGPLAHEVYQR